MKATEVIAKLQELVDEHGDWAVWAHDDTGMIDVVASVQYEDHGAITVRA